MSHPNQAALLPNLVNAKLEIIRAIELIDDPSSTPIQIQAFIETAAARLNECVAQLNGRNKNKH